MASRSRPAQGNNSSPRKMPAKFSGRQLISPRVVTSGSLSRPSDPGWGRLRTTPDNAAPRRVQS